MPNKITLPFDISSLKALHLQDEALIITRLLESIEELDIPETSKPIRLKRAYGTNGFQLASAGKVVTPEGAEFICKQLANGSDIYLRCKLHDPTSALYKLRHLGWTKASQPNQWYLIPAYEMELDEVVLSLVEIYPRDALHAIAA